MHCTPKRGGSAGCWAEKWKNNKTYPTGTPSGRHGPGQGTVSSGTGPGTRPEPAPAQGRAGTGLFLRHPTKPWTKISSSFPFSEERKKEKKKKQASSSLVALRQALTHLLRRAGGLIRDRARKAGKTSVLLEKVRGHKKQNTRGIIVRGREREDSNAERKEERKKKKKPRIQTRSPLLPSSSSSPSAPSQ